MRVLLPADKAMVVGASPRDDTVEELYRGQGTVLVVDDDDLVIKMTTSAVSMLGFEVWKIADLSDALRHALHQEGADGDN